MCLLSAPWQQEQQFKQTSYGNIHCACVVVLLSLMVEKVLEMWHLELPEMKAEVTVVALLTFPITGFCYWNQDRNKKNLPSGPKSLHALL